jgi:hypothetical protein
MAPDPDFQLLNLVGSPRSGSTLLGYLLSNHTRVQPLINEFLNEPFPEGDCTCGEPIVHCPHWKRVVEILEREEVVQRRSRTVRKRTAGGRVRLPAAHDVLLGVGGKWLLDLGRRRSVNVRDVLDAAEDAWKVFQAAAEAFDASVVLNSTLRPETALGLFRTRPSPAVFKLIHLIRDGRGSAYSIMQYRDLPMEDAARNWRWRTLSALLAYSRVPRASRLRVRYEQICADPEGELTRILRFVGLPYEAGMETLQPEGKHRIGGSPSPRLWTGTIEADDRWRTELSPEELRSFSRQAGPMNRLLGYR